MKSDCHRRRAAATGSLGQYAAVVRHDWAGDGRRLVDCQPLVHRAPYGPSATEGPHSPAQAGAVVWSLYLAWNVISRHGANDLRRLTAFACVGLGTAVVGYGWHLQFWGWS